VLATIQTVVYLLLYLIVFGMCVVAVVDAARRNPKAFREAGKRTKGFWVGILAVATAVAFVAIPWPLGMGLLSILALASAAASGVYLADVRPAVARHSGGGSRGRGARGSRGGW
jgi:cobalamin synthase